MARKSIGEINHTPEGPGDRYHGPDKNKSRGADTGRLAKCIKGLTPNQKTILFQFANGMLVNNERLHRLGKEDSPNCRRCGKLDDRCHLLRCEFNKQVNRGVMKVIEEVTGNTVGDDRLGVLDLQIPSALQLPLMYLLSETIQSLQVQKQKDRYLKVDHFKAEISA